MQYPLPTGVLFFPSLKTQGSARHWWCTPLISALGGQRQVDLYEFQDSLGYTEKSLSQKTKTESMKIQGLSLVVILLCESVL